ncbi:MAG TPA: redoxin family protein [Phycisphaerae bacterium]|nr:redoxin family protein [Phycisphaerae bacterium]
MRAAGWIVPLFILFFDTALRGDLTVGDKAPPVTALKWYNLPDGMKTVKPADLKGKITIVEFWATWCGPCKAQMPHLIEIQDKYKSKGVILLALSAEPETVVSRFVKERELPYVIGAGAEAANTRYGVQGIPRSFLVDPEGKIAWIGHPAAMDPELKKLLAKSPAKGRSFLVAGSPKALFKRAEANFKKKKYDKALAIYKEVAGDYAHTKEGKASKKKLKSIRGDSEIMAKIKRARAERKADGLLRAARALLEFGDRPDAVKYFQRILDKYPDTNAAKQALDEIESANGGGDPDGEQTVKKPSRKKQGKKIAAIDEDDDSDSQEEDGDSEEESDDEE